MTASMPDFIQAGMDFFSGKTVTASTLAIETEKLNAALARVKEFEAAVFNPAPLNEKIAALEGQVSAKDAEIVKVNATIKTLEENYQTAARQAQIQISKAGATPPVIVDAPKNDKVTFSDRVTAKVATGKGRATAISECINEFPAEYAEWRNGDTSKI